MPNSGGIRRIAAKLDRSPSTISRELRLNVENGKEYRATTAHALAYDRASRAKPPKLVTNLRLRAKVEADLATKCSPEQISGRLRAEFSNDPEMQVCPETIYLSLYVQSRGALKRDLTRYLRTGRAVRRPSRKVGQRKNRIPDMINIAERPAEADDRAVPGHWEGDLIIGKGNLSAIGTTRTGRSYRGGSSAANAERTVFRATPNRREIALIAIPSDLCSRRISAQSSILITPSLWPRRAKIRSASRGQYWRGVDTRLRHRRGLRW